MALPIGYRSAIFSDLAKFSDDGAFVEPFIQAKDELKPWTTNGATVRAADLILKCMLDACGFLSLARLQLTSLPSALRRCTPLQELVLDDNQLNQEGSLPEALRELRGLKILTLNENDLTAVPSVVMRIASLEHLCLVGNPRLSALPPTLGDLYNLTSLTLDRTGFKEVPFAITYPPRLMFVSLRSNYITLVPDWVPEGFKGTLLDLAGNPIPRLALRSTYEALRALELAGKPRPKIIITAQKHTSQDRPPLLDVAPDAKRTKPDDKTSPEIASS